MLGAACLVVLVVVTLRFELLFLAGWLLWWPRRSWAAAGALAWTSLVLWVPLGELMTAEMPPDSAMATVGESAGPDSAGGGLVYLDMFYGDSTDAVPDGWCSTLYSWGETLAGGGRIRRVRENVRRRRGRLAGGACEDSADRRRLEMLRPPGGGYLCSEGPPAPLSSRCLSWP